VIAPYLDSSAIIYLIEGSRAVRAQVEAHIAGADTNPTGRLITSHLARLECRVKPLRDGDVALLATYDAIFTRARVVVVDLTAAVLDRATELRARHGFRTPDAIHLTCAMEAGADAFLTGDAGLAKCPGMTVELLTP
jgi:predicted nucleic acid-binding protein